MVLWLVVEKRKDCYIKECINECDLHVIHHIML